ncbi:hypothetical protein GVX82_02490 [Patescibacteria group bacterium]|jgi:uncharacterized membrane protein|nr:hypothetical protein [Patescibacteria group bacterium]
MLIRIATLALTLLTLTAPQATLAQGSEQPRVLEAVVVRVISEGEKELERLNMTVESQVLEVKVLGEEAPDELVPVENDYLPVAEGQRIFVRENVSPLDGEVAYGIIEVKRTNALLWLFLLFAAVIVGFGGWQGVRSLVSLAASLFIILCLLVPALTAGLPPILTSIGVAFLVMFGAVFFTHGFNRKSLAAFLGSMVAICATGLLAWGAVEWTMLTGFGSDESIFLNMNTGGTLDFSGLLLGAIIIGILGVLDDIAITQVAVVAELLALRTTQSYRDIFWRAIRVGREHVAALVNTLVLAYTGAALPLLLWVSTASTNFYLEANREIFAAEIVRTLVGSVGLVLTVPLTTLLAVYLLRSLSHDELEQIGGHGHHH